MRVRRTTVVLTAVALLVMQACDDGGGDEPGPLIIDGPAQVDPDFRNDGGSGDRSDDDG